MLKKRMSVLYIQGLVVIYSLTSVLSKVASNFMKEEGMLSLKVILSLGLMILVLGCYAILWQQVLKKTELSVAYMNKGMQLFWALLWSVLFFNETVTFANIVGSIVIFIGIMVVSKV